MNGIVVRAYSKAKDGGTKPFMSNGKRCTNFKVSEFACSDGTDPVFIAPALVTPALTIILSLLVGTPVFAEFRYAYAVFLVCPLVLPLTLFSGDRQMR